MCYLSQTHLAQFKFEIKIIIILDYKINALNKKLDKSYSILILKTLCLVDIAVGSVG